MAEPTPAQPAAPTPTARPSNLAALRQQYAAAEAERKKREEEEKQRQAAASAPKPSAPKPAPAQLDASLADDISAIINTDSSTGATTGQGGTPTLGDTDGTSARLSRSAIDGFVAKIKQCWSLMPADYGMSVTLNVAMNRDGTVNGTPQIVTADPSPSGQMLARAAQRAVSQCGPYDMLSADAYDEWRQIEVELRP